MQKFKKQDFVIFTLFNELVFKGQEVFFIKLRH